MENSKSSGSGSADSNFLLGPVLLLGAPGVGKGTQAQRLVRTFGVPQISTGDLLREHARRRSELGESARLLMEAGKLVPDELVNKMVAERLTMPDTEIGFVLDGFPRTEGQSKWLDTKLSTRAGMIPLVAMQILVPEPELLQRITARRICPQCQHIYNLYSHPPRVEGICDLDGSPLLHRSDDTEAAFRKRMLEYNAKTAAVIDHYRRQGRFCDVNGLGSEEAVEMSLLAALQHFRVEQRVDGPCQFR